MDTYFFHAFLGPLLGGFFSQCHVDFRKCLIARGIGDRSQTWSETDLIVYGEPGVT